MSLEAEGLRAPFPYFGGKSRVAGVVWARLGDVDHYVEPFAGSAAVLLARPNAHQWWNRAETINDADGFVANFWRAVQKDPDAVAAYADWPINEIDLHARHAWLVEQRQDLSERLLGDPEYYDAKMAGWWVWGQSTWLGRGWCSGVGPWVRDGGRLVRRRGVSGAVASKPCIWRQLSSMSGGRGVHRSVDVKPGVWRKLPSLTSSCGVHRLADVTVGELSICEQWSDYIRTTMRTLADRLRRVRVCAGDWRRVVAPSVTTVQFDTTGIFLDPPYDPSERKANVYAIDAAVSSDVREWAIAHGDDPRLRIALCGYEGEHEMPPSWSVYRWKANGGYANQGEGRGRQNAHRETIWFSPHCLRESEVQLTLEGLEL